MVIEASRTEPNRSVPRPSFATTSDEDASVNITVPDRRAVKVNLATGASRGSEVDQLSSGKKDSHPVKGGFWDNSLLLRRTFVSAVNQKAPRIVRGLSLG
jgi:hypothetical protein